MEPDSTVDALAGGRVRVLIALVVIFLAVSVVAYTDYPRAVASEPLTELERDGLAIWRGNNCQACHQLYGFGGFHGPDLTNYVTEAKLDVSFRDILYEGYGKMPALELSDDDQEAVLAFLRAVHRSGRSRPRALANRNEPEPIEHLARLITVWGERRGEVPAAVREGVATWTSLQCGVCHVPFTEGKNRAPDLSEAARDRSPGALGDLLRESRGKMPAFRCRPEEIDGLSGLLEWTTANRADLVALDCEMCDREEFAWTSVPWFEYE